MTEGPVKDRIAEAIIEEAEKGGKIESRKCTWRLGEQKKVTWTLGWGRTCE